MKTTLATIRPLIAVSAVVALLATACSTDDTVTTITTSAETMRPSVEPEPEPSGEDGDPPSAADGWIEGEPDWHGSDTSGEAAGVSTTSAMAEAAPAMAEAAAEMAVEVVADSETMPVSEGDFVPGGGRPSIRPRLHPSNRRRSLPAGRSTTTNASRTTWPTGQTSSVSVYPCVTSTLRDASW